MTMESSARQPKLLDRVRQAVRVRHYSRRTEVAYVHWIKTYIVFHGKVHPASLGAAHVSAFVSWLAEHRRVSASTQNQALSAVLFLYRHVLAIELDTIPPVARARTPERLPVVLSRSEVASLFGQLSGPLRLIVTLLYGAGLRLDECLELRVKDLDFERDRITVRQGKGRKDRVTMLPASAKEPLRTDWDASCFRTRSSGSLRVRRRTGGGNLCFRRGACAAIRDLGSRHGITCTNRSCRRQSRGRRVQRV